MDSLKIGLCGSFKGNISHRPISHRSLKTWYLLVELLREVVQLYWKTYFSNLALRASNHFMFTLYFLFATEELTSQDPLLLPCLTSI